MHIYLPIAEISMHIAVVIGLGGGVGFLSECLALEVAF